LLRRDMSRLRKRCRATALQIGGGRPHDAHRASCILHPASLHWPSSFAYSSSAFSFFRGFQTRNFEPETWNFTPLFATPGAKGCIAPPIIPHSPQSVNDFLSLFISAIINAELTYGCLCSISFRQSRRDCVPKPRVVPRSGKQPWVIVSASAQPRSRLWPLPLRGSAILIDPRGK